jgi:predicted transcriptional regulator
MPYARGQELFRIALKKDLRKRFDQLAEHHHRPVYMEAELALMAWLERYEGNPSPTAVESQS